MNRSNLAKYTKALASLVPYRRSFHEAAAQEALLTFGKHKGKPIKQLDDEYLRWMLTRQGSPWWRKLASQVLEQRSQEQKLGTKSRRTSLLAELKECRNLSRGKTIHAEAMETGDDSCMFVATALVSMYAKCGSMPGARQAFDRIQHPDVVAWNALIVGYAENGDGSIALDSFERMKSRGCAPDRVGFLAALRACSSLALKLDARGKATCLERGKRLHAEISSRPNICLHGTLIDMYVKCGSMLDARQVFDSIKNPDVVPWAALIMGYAANGEGIQALDLFGRMKRQGCVPNSFVFVAALKACTSLALEKGGSGKAECLKRGKQIHSEVGSHLDIFVQNTLIDMYAKCGVMDDARQVFDSVKHPTVVSWNALISGYAENGECLMALELFAVMKSRGCAPNYVTFIAALKASALLGALETGRRIHAEMGNTTERHAILVTCLVDFYSSCGNLVEAREVFDSHPGTRDLTTWNALCTGYSRSGDNKAVFGLFRGLQDAGLRPNGVTYLCILNCCSHAGLVERAMETLQNMSKLHGVAPTVEHYSCVVDILGRSNKLDDAMGLLRSMPCRPNAVTWKAVLGASRKWKNVGMGRLAFRALVSLDETISASYVLMAHLYGWEEQEMVLGMRPGLEKANWT